MAHDELLRHGLPIPQVDAALVSNVAEDHLGQYGINSIAALTAATMMVAKAASKALVLNADDANLVEYVQKNHAKVALSTATNKRNQTSLISVIEQVPVSPNLPEHITWFSLDETNPVIVEARENRQKVCFIRDSKIIYATAGHESEIIDINVIPMQGATVNNVQNALGAVALSKALGIDEHAIREALAMMS
jgi:UDP-N-acetylmuramoylalanine-D-glutamate ligase